MKLVYKVLASLSFLLIYPNFISAQFSGGFAPTNWGTVAVNSDGITNSGGAPASIFMVSGNNSSGTPGTNDYTIAITQAGLITFNWNYTTSDGANWDYPMFLLNGVATMVNGYSTSGSAVQSGSQTCIPVSPGNVFGFRMYTVDNVAGAATTTFSSLSFITSSVTVTPATPSVCAGGTVALTATGGSNLSWSGGISNGVPFTPTAPTVYTVTSGSGGCITTKTVLVDYFAPLSIAGPTGYVCANTTTSLVALGGSGFLWSTGSTASSISITPSVSTTYSVSGTTTAGCSSNVAKTVSVNVGVPSLTVVSTPSTGGTCPNNTVVLTAGGATTYTWSSNLLNGVPFAPVVSGTYVVTGENACGTSTVAVSVSIHPLPTVSGIASSPTICSGNPVSLTGVGN
ncbi:MAG: hypothetical protein PSX36_11640, partial [bacterium]|nr:hypothetical protein [bacterium]